METEAEDTRQEEHAQKIKAKFEILVEGLSCFQEMVGIMYGKGKLNSKEKEEILKYVASYELYSASERLLHIVSSGPLEVYNCFLEALWKTRQTDVYKMLVNKNICLSAEEVDALPRNRIREAYTSLTENLDVSSDLLGRLHAKKILTRSEFEKCTADELNPIKIDWFLSIIGRKSYDDFATFEKILEEIGQGHVSKMISGSAPVKTRKHNKKSSNQVISGPERENNNIRKVDHSCFLTSRIRGRSTARDIWKVMEKRSRKEKDFENAVDNSHLTELSIKVMSSERETKTIRDAILQNCIMQLREDIDLERKECLQAKEDCNKIHMELDQSREALKRARRPATNRPNDGEKLNESYEPRRNDAKLIHITSKTAANRNAKAIWGVTVLENRIYVVSRWTPIVEVYERAKFSFIGRRTVDDLFNPGDIRASVKSNQLFIVDATYPAKSKSILRVEPSGMKVAVKWDIGDYEAILSVTEESNVIATIYANHTLIEYTPEGEEVHRIDLSKTGMMHPWHAVKLSNGNFVVCHGHYDEPVHRVCEIDRKGLILKSFGGPTNVHDLDVPINLAIDTLGSIIVADYRNCRVLLLSSDLKYQKELLSKQFVITRPSRLHLDEENGTLIIADNEAGWKNGRVLAFKIDMTY